MSRLLILGGSNCQRNALIAARKSGHETVLVDYLPHPPAAAFADVHLRVSTFDIPACIAAAKAHAVDGVFTIGTDQPVLTAARVAAACGLPSLISPETALAVTNKRVMKQTLARHGISTARWLLLGENDPPDVLRELCAPLVLKPLDSQGQRGIFKLDTAEAVCAHLPETLTFSREHEGLVEEFYPSDEITVSAWVQAGRVHLLAVTDRQLYDHPTHIGVCVGHRYPSVHAGLMPQIDPLVRQIAAAFEIADGPLYVQLLAGERGLLVNELACRIGGAFEDVFIPWLTGFDILDAVIRGALGLPVVCAAADAGGKQVSVQLLFCYSGRAAQITPIEQLRALPGVRDAGYNFAPGDEIPALENATARFGHCVLTAEHGDIASRIDTLYRTLQVLDDDGRNLVIPRDFAGKGVTL